jgi:hypothetical protein
MAINRGDRRDTQRAAEKTDSQVHFLCKASTKRNGLFLNRISQEGKNKSGYGCNSFVASCPAIDLERTLAIKMWLTYPEIDGTT